MRAQKKAHRVVPGELTLGGDDEGLEHQVRARQMRGRLVHVGVGDLDDGLGHQPSQPIVRSEHRVVARRGRAFRWERRRSRAVPR